MLLELSQEPKASKQDFQELVEQLRSMNYLIQLQIQQVKGVETNLPSTLFESLKQNISPQQSPLWTNWFAEDPLLQLVDIESTEKWHPIIYAVANGNLDLTKHLISSCLCNIKKALKVPGLYNTQMMFKIFPLVIALTNATSPASNFSVSIGG